MGTDVEAGAGPSSSGRGGVAETLDEPGVTLRCWGTRGSIPSPGPATAGYGGNTPCLEVRAGERRVVFDAGSGLRLLGLHLMETGAPLDTSIFLTHFHWDHIQGFPFFWPLYRPEANLRIFGPRQGDMDIESLFAGQMGPIYFPVPFSAVAATTSFEHLNGGIREEDGLTVSSMRVRHASFTVGYRVDVDGVSICFVPDNELVGGEYDVGDGWRRDFVEFVGDADLLIHDAMYTEDEYPAKVGWGHSTLRQAMALAHEAGVRRLLFYHHAPERGDDELDRLVAEARKASDELGYRTAVDAAREGFEFQVRKARS